jgi:hypothetical protein
VALSGSVTMAINQTLSMRPDVDRVLVAHLVRTPGVTVSSA